MLWVHWKLGDKVLRCSLFGRDSGIHCVTTAFSSAQLFWLIDECTQQMVFFCYVTGRRKTTEKNLYKWVSGISPLNPEKHPSLCDTTDGWSTGRTLQIRAAVLWGFLGFCLSVAPAAGAVMGSRAAGLGDVWKEEGEM